MVNLNEHLLQINSEDSVELALLKKKYNNKIIESITSLEKAKDVYLQIVRLMKDESKN